MKNIIQMKSDIVLNIDNIFFILKATINIINIEFEINN